MYLRLNTLFFHLFIILLYLGSFQLLGITLVITSLPRKIIRISLSPSKDLTLYIVRLVGYRIIF